MNKSFYKGSKYDQFYSIHDKHGWCSQEPYGSEYGILLNGVSGQRKHSIVNNHAILFVAVLCLLVSFTGCVVTTEQTIFEVRYLDVGQGDAIFVRYQKPGITIDILIDTGPNSSAAREELGEAILTYNITDLDFLILTHPDADHIGNAVYILEMLPTRSIYRSGFNHSSETVKYLDNWLEKHSTSVVVTQGEEILLWPQEIWLDDHFSLSFLHSDPLAGNVNDASLVTYIRWYCEDFLFMGDVSKSIEYRIMQGYPSFNWATIDYLKVAHHGSRFSTSKEFLTAVAPKNAIISSALGNRYGHPHEETILHLSNQNITIYATYLNGTISYQCTSSESYGGSICISTER